MDETKSNAYFIGIKFTDSEKSYYFSTDDADLKQGDFVIVETPSGIEMAKASTPLMSQAIYHSPLQLKPILRKPTKRDMEDYQFNLEQDRKALAIISKEVQRLGLPMDSLKAHYNLDGSKITITYTSVEKRVDFRELLRILPPLVHAHIEFRQLSFREKARQVGGIGICGLPFCCSTFLTWSQPIGIALAKNQMLTLNVQKLSGPCGKLLCCLAFENDTYDIEKKDFPRLGTVVHLEEGDYHVISFNIISRTVKLTNATKDNYKTVSLEDCQAMMSGTYKKPTEVVKEDKLPDFNIPGLETPAPRKENSQQRSSNNQKQRNDRNNSFKKNQQNRNHSSNQGNQNPQGKEQGSKQNSSHHYRPHHGYHSHGNSKGNGSNK